MKELRNWRQVFVFALAVALLTVGAAMAQVVEMGRAQLSQAIAVQERHNPALFSIPEVVATGVGVSGTRPVVKVYLSRPGGASIPDVLDGVPVAISVIGEIVSFKGPPGGGVDPTGRFPRPVPIGVSTGHPDITAGTIGARVTDGANVWALSNNHVYADSNAASIGDAVIQPGTFDGGVSPADDIGNLDDFEPINFSGACNNVMDAAIAATTTALVDNATPSDGYGTPQSSAIAASVGMRVMKYGRTTGQTRGRVDSINATVNVNYGAEGVACFVNQIVITPGSFSAGGDSGSLIVVQRGSDARRPVGLLFAGSSQATIANPIGPVLTRFGVTVDGN